MAIRLKYDAAAVTSPSKASTMKFGQQLVQQEQQRKYNAQQQGYDRLFTLGRDVQQNQNQFVRDVRQNTFQEQLNRDQNTFAAQQAETKRQQAFMDEARKQSSGMIMQDIQDGAFDPVTARKLQQTIVAESEALGNPGLDATQRAEALAKIRAERTMLSANRLQKPPKPTRDEELQQFLGANYGQYKDLPWVPDGKGGFTTDKNAIAMMQKEQDRQQQAEQEAAKIRPQSFQDYYNANKDKFQKDLDATMNSMQAAVEPDKEGNAAAVTQDQALAKMQKDYEFRQKALGRPQYGEPTPAPTMPGASPASLGTERSILEPAGISQNSPLGQLRDTLGMNQAAPSQSTLTAQTPDTGLPPSPSKQPQNPWKQMASGGDVQPATAAPVAQQASNSKPPAAPDFSSLASSATDDADRSVIGNLQGMYDKQSPDIQTAINVFLSPNSLSKDAAQAIAYLKAKGIDLEKMAASSQELKNTTLPWRSKRTM